MDVRPTRRAKPARRLRFTTSIASEISSWRRGSRCGAWKRGRDRRGPMPYGTGWRESTGSCRLPGCRWRSCLSLLSLLRFLRLLAALGRLGAELLRESLDAAFRVDQLLPAREERMTVRADFEMELGLGRAGYPRRAAGAARV